MSVARTSSSGSAKLTYKASCSSVDSKNTLATLKIYQKLSTASTWPSSATTSISLSGTSANGSITISGLESSSSYDFKAIVVDEYGSSTEAISSISSEFRILNINANKTGLSIGKMSDDDIFDCTLPAKFLNTLEFGETILGSLGTGQTTDSDGIVHNIVYIRPGQAVNDGADMALAINNDCVYVASASNSGLINLGSSNRKWKQLYAASGTIETSDRKVKTDITDMSCEQAQLFGKLRPVKYKFSNGDSGRTHFGFVSQDVEDALNELNLTGKDFAGFCKDLRVDDCGEAVLDQDGQKIYDYSLRYTEFIALNTYMIQKLMAENALLKEELQTIKEMIATN